MDSSAYACKDALHQTEYRGHRLEVNALNPKLSEAPIWKMQQRKLWVTSPFFTDLPGAFSQCREYGTVTGLKSSCGKLFVRFLRATEADLASKSCNGHVPSAIEFATQVCPGEFEIVRSSFRMRQSSGQQVMAVVIDPLPSGIGSDDIAELLSDCQDYAIWVRASAIENGGRRAIVYTKSRRAMMKVHGKLHNARVGGELLPLARYSLREIPNAPRHHPFEGLHRPRKMAIVADPVVTELDEEGLIKILVDCGKYDVEFTGSAVVEGGRRLIVQPRNLRAKSECFRLLNAAMVKCVRMRREDIPRAIGEAEEEDEDFT
jgi:hypothetical protein